MTTTKDQVDTFPTSRLTDLETANGWRMCSDPSCNEARRAGLVRGVKHAHRRSVRP